MPTAEPGIVEGTPADQGALAEAVERLAQELFAAQGAPPATPEIPSPVSPSPSIPMGGLPTPLADLPSMPASPPPVPPEPSAPMDAPYFLSLAGFPKAEPTALPLTPSIPIGGFPSVQADVPSTPAAAPPAPSPPSTPTEQPYFLGLAGMPVSEPSAATIPIGGLPGAQGSIPATDVLPPPAVDEPPSPSDEPAWPIATSFEPELVPELDVAPGVFDPNVIKRDFPILQERVRGRPLVWLDNAATTQKPQAVIDRLSYYYEHENSNVHRGAHTLAARATDAYEQARDKVRRFLNAGSPREIVFVRGATEGINLVAQSWGRRHVEAGDEIVITWLEHHANIVPWQMLCSEKGARLRVAPVDDDGQVLLDEYEKLLGPRTRIVAIPHVSNALGTIVPAQQMVEMAHRHGAKVLVDGAQAVSHMPVDVQLLDCDFYVFSGHKIFAPTGIGVVFGKVDLLDRMPPWQGGGNMIADVTFEKTTYNPAPVRFEAGTASIGDAVGLGAALDYVNALGLGNIERYEHDLRVYAEACLRDVPGLRMIGTAPDKAGVMSFVLDGQRTEDVGALLDLEGIAVRSGHHCAQPIHRRFGLEASVRASLAPYNTRDDIKALVAALNRLQEGRRGVP